MPQILFLAAVGIVAWFGYRKMLQSAEAATERLRRKRDEHETGAQGTLIKDPTTGEYHVRRDD